jgi:hypothetical protein
MLTSTRRSRTALDNGDRLRSFYNSVFQKCIDCITARARTALNQLSNQQIAATDVQRLFAPAERVESVFARLRPRASEVLLSLLAPPRKSENWRMRQTLRAPPPEVAVPAALLNEVRAEVAERARLDPDTAAEEAFAAAPANLTLALDLTDEPPEMLAAAGAGAFACGSTRGGRLQPFRTR